MANAKNTSKFSLIWMGGWAEGLVCADLGERTPISGRVEMLRHFWLGQPFITQIFRAQTLLMSYFRPDRQKYITAPICWDTASAWTEVTRELEAVLEAVLRSL